MSNDTESPEGHKKLEQIAASLERENVEAVTVRELLQWFGAERRGRSDQPDNPLRIIQKELFTEPELNQQYRWPIEV